MHPTPSIETVLKDASWLRALAVQLVGGCAADDLVQDTYLAALDRKAEPRDGRAWLVTVMRRLASNTRRGELRERDRRVAWAEAEVTQRAAGPRAAGPTPATRLERLELQQALLAAVGELPPDFAEVVLRCHMDGQTPAAVAAELGLPAGTVRSRLARALVQLRGKLDERFGREAWLGALAPWVAPLLHMPPAPNGLAPATPAMKGLPTASSATTSSATGWGFGSFGGLAGGLGGWFMWKWTLAVVALVVLGLGLWEFVGVPTPLEREGVATRPAKAALQPQSDASREPTNPDRLAVVATPQPARKETPAPPAAQPPWGVDLIVVDAVGGVPLAGVEFRLLDSSHTAQRSGDLTRLLGAAPLLSDAFGALRIDREDRLPYWGFLRKPGYAERVLALDPQVTESGQAVVVELAAIETLHVRVLDSAGQPVPGALLSAVAPWTDLQAKIGGSRWIFLSGRGWDGRWRRSAAMLTNARGETQLGLFTAALLELEVRLDGELVAAARAPAVDVVGGESWITLHLGERLAIEGRVLDVDGNAVAGQRMELHFANQDRWRPETERGVLTDADGRFRIDPVPIDAQGVPMDRLLLGGDAGRDFTLPAGQRVPEVRVPWEQAVDGVVRLELQAVQTQAIAGVIVDAHGRELEAGGTGTVEVWTRDQKQPVSVSFEGARFEVASVLPGAYSLTFRTQGGAKGPEVLAYAGDRAVRLEAPTTFDLQLELVRGPELPAGTLIGNGIRVALSPLNGGPGAASRRSTFPRSFSERVPWNAQGLAAGRYRAIAWTEEGLVGSVDVDVPHLAEGPLEVPMGASGALSVEADFETEGLWEPQLYLGWGGEVVRYGGGLSHAIEVPVGTVTVWGERPDGTRASATVTVAAGEKRSVRLE